MTSWAALIPESIVATPTPLPSTPSSAGRPAIRANAPPAAPVLITSRSALTEATR